MSIFNLIRPDYKPHLRLEDRVIKFLKKNGFLVGDLTYHRKLDRSLVQLLQNRYSPTALYLRGRADRIAVHRELLLEFEWEAKTHKSKKYHDLTMEALPLVHHLSKLALGVDCLYIHHNPFNGREVSFWISEMPIIRTLWIPTNRWRGQIRIWFRDVLTEWIDFDDLVEAPVRRAASRDPFIIIDEQELQQLSHWTESIQDAMTGAES